jgi:DNA end-binding protein Ku
MPSIVWKGHLTFGLVSIPVKLYRAARKERVRLHYVHQPQTDRTYEEQTSFTEPAAETKAPGGIFEKAVPLELEPEAPVSRVRQTLVPDAGDEPVSRSEVLRGYEVEPDRYVVFNPDELKGLRRRTSPTMEIVRSVRLSEIDPVFLETSYYVVPDRGGEKAYAILFAALQANHHVALARVGMYGREHVVIVRPGKHGMLAHTMFYVDEIRFENEFRTDLQTVGAKELELAKTFLVALEAPFHPEEFKDEYREQLQAMIETKRSRAAVTSTAGMPAGPPPVVDIFEALKKSIAMARKPAERERQPARKSPARVTEIKSKKRPRTARS